MTMVAVEAMSRAARRLFMGSLDGLARTSSRLVGRHRTIRGVERAAQWLQFTHGHLQGLEYELRGRTPAPDVGDDVLTARVRSELGPLLHRLDLPRLHVMVNDGVAVLHGDVATGDQAEQVVGAARGVGGDRRRRRTSPHRPDAWRHATVRGSRPPRSVVSAQAAAGGSERRARRTVEVVMVTLAELVPEEVVDILAALPAELKQLWLDATTSGD